MFPACKALVASHLLRCKLISESYSSLLVLSGMSLVVRDIFRFRAKEYFRNPRCVPTGFMGDIVGLLKKNDLHSYFSLCINADLSLRYILIHSVIYYLRCIFCMIVDFIVLCIVFFCIC